MSEHEVTWYADFNHPKTVYQVVVADVHKRGLGPCTVDVLSIGSVGEREGDPVGWVVRYATTPLSEDSQSR